MYINDSVYGAQEITDPLVLALIETPEMQRLKGINQYGVLNLIDSHLFTSRFDHSVGVYLLLRKLKAPREEQIAGLLHDISHTAFSHVIDYVYDDHVGQTVHEKFHHQVISHSKIPQMLMDANLNPDYVLNEKNHGLLERDLPDLCADRLDYFLRDSLIIGVNSPQMVQRTLEDIFSFAQGMMFTNTKIAKNVFYGFMETCRVFWGNAIQSGAYQLMADTLKLGLDEKVITEKDFFLADEEVLTKLISSGNARILENLELFDKDAFSIGTPEDYTYHVKTKTRYVDPNIHCGQGIFRTSQFFPELKVEIEKFKEEYSKGFYIKIQR